MQKITLVLVLLCVFGAASAQSVQSAPDLSLKEIGGRRFQVSDYRGRVLLLNFWATWCPPCRTEIPDLIKMQRKYAGRGLQIIGITYPPQTPSQVRRFAHRFKINYPVALGNKETKLLFTQSETLPMSVIIDSKGNVRDVIEGIIFPEEFDQKIKPLLSEHPVNLAAQRPRPRKELAPQRVTILVTGEGYRPARIRLRRDVPVQLTFVRKVAESCGTEIIIPAYGINKPLPLNVPVVIAFTPRRTGPVKMTCGMNMFRGSLIVR